MAKSHFLVLGSLLISLIFSSCDFCGNQILEKQVSPNGQWQLIKFDRDCGATTGNSIQISILPNNIALGNEAGNTFVSEVDSVSMQWIGEKEVLIRYPEYLKTYTKEASIQTVRVSYAITK